jgi:hypothetical protein
MSGEATVPASVPAALPTPSVDRALRVRIPGRLEIGRMTAEELLLAGAQLRVLLTQLDDFGGRAELARVAVLCRLDELGGVACAMGWPAAPPRKAPASGAPRARYPLKRKASEPAVPEPAVPEPMPTPVAVPTATAEPDPSDESEASEE